MKVGLFGSACNPPHNGHADVIQQALHVFDRVIVVPSYVHPFGKVMAPFDLRLGMVQAMVDELHGGDRVVVSDIERDMYEARVAAGSPCPVYTWQLLSELDVRFPDDSHMFVAGHDVLAPETWSKYCEGDLIKSRWGVWEAKENLNVRSSIIRPALASAEIDQLPVADGVKRILSQHRYLYE